MNKIGILIDTPFALGGMQRVCTVVANYLANRGFSVSFLVFGRNIKTDYQFYGLNETVNLIMMNDYNKVVYRALRRIPYELKKLKNTRNLFGYTLKGQINMFANSCDAKIIAGYINNNDLDYVIGPAIENTIRLAAARKYLKKAKIIGWQHSTSEAYFKTPGIRLYNMNKAADFAFKNIDEYVVLTEHDKERIKEYFDYESVVIRNPNTFNSEQVSDLTSKTFLAAGRFVQLKGFDRLIEAFRLFCKENEDWNLLLIGDGPEKVNYLQLIEKYNICDRVIMPGKSDKMDQHYLNSSVYVMTSKWEGWGMTVAEAMEYGLPIISFDLPSIHEMIGNADCGIVVPMNDIQAMADAMKELASHQDRLREMGKNAKMQIKLFNADIVCKKWLEILK